MTRRPTTDPAIELARQALRARRIVELRQGADQLDRRIALLDRRIAAVMEAIYRNRRERCDRDLAAEDALARLHRDRRATVDAIDTRLAELARLRNSGS